MTVSSLKRPHGDESLDNRDLKRIRRSEPIERQWIFSVQQFPTLDDTARNHLYLSQHDYAKIFSHHSLDQSRCLQIANRVYMVAVKDCLSEGKLGFNPIQYRNVADYITENKKGETIVATLFDEDLSEVMYLEEIVFTINFATEFAANRERKDRYYQLELIQTAILAQFRGQIVGKGQTLLLNLFGEPFELTISTIKYPESEENYGCSTFGQIDNKTQFHFIHSRVSMPIVSRVVRDNIDSFHFTITVVEKVHCTPTTPLPIILSIEDLRKEILKELHNRPVVIETSITIDLKNGYILEVELSGAKISEDKRHSQIDHGENQYQTAYLFSEHSYLYLDYTRRDLIITSDELFTADHIEFKIIKYAETDGDALLKPFRSSWISVHDIKNALMRQHGNCFAFNEFIRLRLSSGEYDCQVTSITSSQTEPQTSQLKFPAKYKIQPETLIDFKVSRTFQLKLVHNDESTEARKMEIEVSPRRRLMLRGKKLLITTDELRYALTEKSDSHHVEGRQVYVQVKGHELNLKVKQLFFYHNFAKEKYGRLGQIGDSTTVNFYSNNSNIVIIEEVPRKYIEKYKFKVSVKKRSYFKGHTSLLPLVFSFNEIIEKIHEKFAEKKLKLGKHLTIRTQFGWDLRIEFSGVEYTSDSPINVDLDSRENIYPFDEEGPIHLGVKNSELVLFQDEPIMAEHISFEIEDYSRSREDDYLSFFHQPWVSIEELKHEIQKRVIPYFPSQKFSLRISSGELLVRVASVNAPGNFESLWGNESRGVFSLSETSTIDVKANSNFEMTLLDCDRAFSLESIEIKIEEKKESSGGLLALLSGDGEEDEGEKIKVTERELKAIFLHEASVNLFQGQTIETVILGKKVQMTVSGFIFQDKNLPEIVHGLLGKVKQETKFDFNVAEKSNVILKSTEEAITDPLQRLEDLGVGGLDEQMRIIVRDIFLQRDPVLGQLMRENGLKQESGILFYGPPGTGKTATARALAKMLGCSGENVTKINASEVFNKYVGESEKNIRKLFEPAFKDWKKFRDKSPMHVIIVDEIDALLGARGDDVNRWRNSVVNQFLALMDGMEEVNNLLVIGMTNRKEALDPAVLRSGRFGTQIEIGIPDAEGRKKIFEIHTKEMREKNRLSDDVDLDRIVAQTHDYTGADIEGLVKKANAFAFERLNGLRQQGMTIQELRNHPDIKVGMKDFLKAIKEIGSTSNSNAPPLGMYA